MCSEYFVSGAQINGFFLFYIKIIQFPEEKGKRGTNDLIDSSSVKFKTSLKSLKIIKN